MNQGEEIPLGLPPSAEESARSRTGYLKPYEAYTAIYQCSLRTVKGWVAAGKDHQPTPLPPPLDDPPAMLAWWRSVKTNRPPDLLVQLAARGAGPAPDPSPAAPPILPAPLPFKPATAPAQPANPAPADANLAEPPAALFVAPSGQTIGYSAFLNRLRHAEANAGSAYAQLQADALTARSTEDRIRILGAADQAYISWTKVTDQMRKAEADAPKILAAAGKNWDADAVLAAMEAFHLVQKSLLSLLVTNLRPRLRACTTETEADILWTAELDRIFGMWSPEQFSAQVVKALAKP